MPFESVWKCYIDPSFYIMRHNLIKSVSQLKDQIIATIFVLDDGSVIKK